MGNLGSIKLVNFDLENHGMVASRKLTLADYKSRQEAGEFLGLSPSVELFGGQVVQCLTGELAEDKVLANLAKWSSDSASSGRHRVLVKSSLEFGTSSGCVLRPSMVWLTLEDRTKHAVCENAQLVIEILKQDDSQWTTARSAICAAAGIEEFWVIKPNACCVDIYREPMDGLYSAFTTHDESSTISPMCEPAAHLSLSKLFATSKPV